MILDHPGSFALPRHSLVELLRGQAYEVGSAAGTLWLTLDHDTRDIVLEPGESFRVDGRQRVLVHALSDAVLRLTQPCTHRPAVRARTARPVRTYLGISMPLPSSTAAMEPS